MDLPLTEYPQCVYYAVLAATRLVEPISRKYGRKNAPKRCFRCHTCKKARLKPIFLQVRLQRAQQLPFAGAGLRVNESVSVAA